MELDRSTSRSQSRLNRTPTSARNYAAVLAECLPGIKGVELYRQVRHSVRTEV